jgi:hypothetical protein
MPAGATYSTISASTVSGSSTTTVTFSSIPGTYTDLVLIVAGNVTPGGLNLTVNSDTSANYSYTRMFGQSGGALSGRDTASTSIPITISDMVNGSALINIQRYANTATYKCFLLRANNSSSYVGAYSGTWKSTSAITSVTITVTSGTISAGTVFSLYGIAAA